MYNFLILLDQTSTMIQTATVSPTVTVVDVDSSSSDSVSDDTAISCCCYITTYMYTCIQVPVISKAEDEC